jgi:hypothetical protein
MIDFRALSGTADFLFMRHGESEGNRDADGGRTLLANWLLVNAPAANGLR